MPADAFVDERHLPPLGLSNAWGYNPVVLGAPDPRLAPGGWAEVRAATDALHAAGLEVVLDIVLNHNGESDEFGPTLSFRGLDNATYFRLPPDDPARYVNDAGCGNCLALDRPPVVAMALTALQALDDARRRRRLPLRSRHGARPARLGLRPAGAAVPGARRRSHSVAGQADRRTVGHRSGGLSARRLSRRLGRVERPLPRRRAPLLARRTARMRGELATRIAGSRDVFSHAPSPAKSVNYIVAHDGFTLADLVAYAHKHNEANGENNRDGTDDNASWNHGVEGPTDDPAILAARARDMRNLLALPYLSRGTPMLAMGAELGHSQHGNNNAYAQDNATTWIDWAKADASLIAFVGRLAKIRRAHPALSRAGLAQRRAGRRGRPARRRMARRRRADDPGVRSGSRPMATCSSSRWRRAPATASTASSSRLNRSPDAACGCACPIARANKAWRVILDTSDDARRRRRAAARRPGAHRRPRDAGAGRSRRADADACARRRRAKSTPSPKRQASPAIGGTSPASGRSSRRQTKLALLDALRLPAATQAQVRESLAKLVAETSARRLPLTHVSRLDAPRLVPLRADPAEPVGPIDATILTEDGGDAVVPRRAGRSGPHRAGRRPRRSSNG